VYLFFEKVQDDEVQIPLYKTTVFWIATAFMLYFAGNFLLFMYAKTTNIDDAFRRNYTLIYSSVTIAKNILLCIGISLKEKRIVKEEEYGTIFDDDDFGQDIPLHKKNLDFLDFDNDSR
jgi:hypothetical protein